MKFKFIIFISCLAFGSTLFAQDIYEVINVRNGLNVRVAPEPQARIIGSLANGTLVEVSSISNGWAEILYNNEEAYISARYIKFKEKKPQDTMPMQNDALTVIEEVVSNENLNKGEATLWTDNWGIDFLPSLYVGASEFIGDYIPKAHCGFGINAGVQFYQKKNNLPQGWMSEASIGYALKGAGGLPIHYFSFIISPAGYVYSFKHDVILFATVGFMLDCGGGYMSAYYKGNSKYYYASPCDVGMQIKVATEWHKFGFAISYDQGFLNTIENTTLALKNFGFNFHFYYRLWDIPHNTIYKPEI